MGRLLFKHSKRFKKQPALFNCVEAALSGSLLGGMGYLKAEAACVRSAHTTQAGYACYVGLGLTTFATQTFFQI